MKIMVGELGRNENLREKRECGLVFGEEKGENMNTKALLIL